MIDAIMALFGRPKTNTKPAAIREPDFTYYGYPNECYEALTPPPLDEGLRADFRAALALCRGRHGCIPEGHRFRKFGTWEEFVAASKTDRNLADLACRVLYEEDCSRERRKKAHERLVRLPGTVTTALRNFAMYKIAANKGKAAPFTGTPQYAGRQLRTVDERGMHLSPWHIELAPREKIAYIQATGKDNHLNSTGLSELHDIIEWNDQDFATKHSYMMRMGSFQIVSYPALRLWMPTADPCHALIQRPGARKPEAEEGGDGSVKGGVSAPKPGGTAPY